MKVSMLHPFTPAAAGVKESSVESYHSRPHRKAMEMLGIIPGYEARIEYFTPRWFRYHTRKDHVTTEFFPVTWKLNGDHKKWKKQESDSCYKFYSKECPDVAIINMSAHSSPFSFKLSKLLRAKGKPYIAMLGGQHYSDTPWIREYYHAAHHLFVHTQLQKRVMEKMDMFGGLDIRVFPLGIDCNYFQPGAPLDSLKDSISLLYVGRIIEWKRVHLAIEVVNKLRRVYSRSVMLRIVGPVASPEYYKTLLTLVKEYNLEGQVEFLGYQDHDRVRDYLLQSDLLLLPSDKETFGMVIVESMGCGVPVAGVKGGHGPDEVIKSGVNGILTSADEYVDEVCRFLEQDSTAMARVKAGARETAVASFNINETFRILQGSVSDCLK